MTKVSDFLERMATDLKIANDFATEKAGVYSLPIEDSAVLITELPVGFMLSCDICPSPTRKLEEFYTHALLGNLFGQGTRGGVLGLSHDSKRLTLSKEIEYNIEYKEFRNILEDFLNAVDFWREQARDFDQI